MLKIIEQTVNGVSVCILEGKLSGFEGRGRIQEKIRELLAKDRVKIILDLSKINWIDSTGLGELIASLSSVKKTDGGNLVLSNVQAPVQSLLKMTNLNQIFDVYNDVDEAVNELKEQ
jgi:anti-sigma B factor antagonist